MSDRQFGPYTVELSNTDKVLFPDSGITKGELIDYYSDVAGVMLPHLEGRPLTLQRFPEGIGEEGFFQQQVSDYFPDWIDTGKTPRADGVESGEAVEHVLCNNQATLVYLANQAAITLHGWLSRASRLSVPDRLLFDLDPSEEDFSSVRRAARQVIALMQELGMNPHVMTTGSRGLHVLAPLQGDADFEEVRKLAMAMAETLADEHPEALTTEQRKNKRQGRLYLDVTRNAYGQSAVVPYTVRAREGAPVATPIALSELDEGELHAQRWTMKNILRRLGQKGDPWADLRRHGTTLAAAREALEERSKREKP